MPQSDLSRDETARLSIPPHIREVMEALPYSVNSLCILLQVHLDGLMQSRSTEISRVGQVPGCIAGMRDWLNREPSNELVRVRVEHILLKAELSLASHAISSHGLDPTPVVQAYNSFVRQNEAVLHDTLFGWIDSMLQDDLVISQTIRFNTMDFASVVSALDSHTRMYQSVLHAIKDYDLPDLHSRDTRLAELRGTLGQAKAFLACFSPTSDSAKVYFDEAFRLLMEDIGLLHKGTDSWLKGLNYLVALEWRRGSFERALRWFSESLQAESPLPAERLGQLIGPDSLVDVKHSQHKWLLLNQLRLCALGQRLGRLKVSAAQVEDSLSHGFGLNYPDNMIVKWLLVIAGNDMRMPDSFIKDLCQSLAQPRKAPILELMRAVELSLVSTISEAHTAGNLLAMARLILKNNAAYGRFGDFLKTSAWVDAVNVGSVSGMERYDIATALPYYYA